MGLMSWEAYTDTIIIVATQIHASWPYVENP